MPGRPGTIDRLIVNSPDEEQRYRYHYLPDLRANNVGLRVAAPPR